MEEGGEATRGGGEAAAEEGSGDGGGGRGADDGVLDPPPEPGRRLQCVALQGFSFPSPPATAGMRSLQTIIEASNNASDERSQDLDDSKTDTPPASVPTAESSFKVRGTSSLKISPRHDLAMIFTCKVCETRSMKMASRKSYEKGVVIARCDGCNNLHLIADRLGWFGEPGSIEDFLAEQGEEVKKCSTETLKSQLHSRGLGWVSGQF